MCDVDGVHLWYNIFRDIVFACWRPLSLSPPSYHPISALGISLVLQETVTTDQQQYLIMSQR